MRCQQGKNQEVVCSKAEKRLMYKLDLHVVLMCKGVKHMLYPALTINSCDKYYTQRKKPAVYYCLSLDKHVVILAERSIMSGLCNVGGKGPCLSVCLIRAAFSRGTRRTNRVLVSKHNFSNHSHKRLLFEITARLLAVSASDPPVVERTLLIKSGLIL